MLNQIALRARCGAVLSGNTPWNECCMNHRRCFVSIGLAALLPMTAGTAQADWQMNLTQGVTDLHMVIFTICVVIGVGVCVAMLYSIVMHRKSRGVTASQFHESTWVEIAWTVIPFAVLAAVAIPAARTLSDIANNDAPDVVINVTAHQWLWEYEYSGAGVHFYSRLDDASNAARQDFSGSDPSSVPHYLRNVDHPMVVPVHAKVLLRIASSDVIHGWWVPALGGKRDAIPGKINEKFFRTNQIGVYRGQCSALCGRGHGFMPIVVDVVSRQAYIAWLKDHGGHLPEDTELPEAAPAGRAAGPGEPPPGQPWTHKQLMARGKNVYSNICAACHQEDGRGIPAAGYPSLRGDNVVNGPVSGHIDQVLNGKAAMPAYRASLSDAEIAAVVTYERNALGNDTGDTVQPKTVKAQR